MPATLLFFLFQSAPAQAPGVARLELLPPSAVVRAGDSVRIQARALDSTGRALAQVPVEWEVSGEGTVDRTGLVRTGYSGYVRVTARAGERTGTLTIAVHSRPTASIEIRPAVRRMVAGSRVTLNGWAFSPDGDRTYEPVAFSSSDRAVAAVTREGRLAATAPGTATVTASAGAIRERLAVTIVPNTVARVTVTPAVASARTGDVVRFTAAAVDRTGASLRDVFIEWSVAALTYKAVGQIDARGAFVAEWPGKYTVTADIGGRRADAVIEVRRRGLGAAIETVGRLPIPFPAEALGFPPDGHCIYIGTDGGPVYVADVSRPDRVRVVDSVPAGKARVSSIQVSPDQPFGIFTRAGGDAGAGVVVLNTSDPCHPRRVAGHPSSDGSGAGAAWLDRTHLYVADAGTGSLRIIDFSRPTHPREVGRWQTATEPGRRLADVSVVAGVAYLAYWNDGLVILDVGNGIRGGRPERPALVAQYRYDLNDMYQWVDRSWGLGARGTHRARRVGDFVLISDEVRPAASLAGTPVFGRVNAIDVSDLTRPNGVAWYEPADAGVQDLWISGDTVYLAAAQGGIRALDAGGELKGNLLAQGRELARLSGTGAVEPSQLRPMVRSVAARNGLIYAADRSAGLLIARLRTARPD